MSIRNCNLNSLTEVYRATVGGGIALSTGCVGSWLMGPMNWLHCWPLASGAWSLNVVGAVVDLFENVVMDVHIEVVDLELHMVFEVVDPVACTLVEVVDCMLVVDGNNDFDMTA